MAEERKRTLTDLNEMWQFLESNPPNEKLKGPPYEVTRRILERATDYAMRYAPPPQGDLLRHLCHDFAESESMNYGEASRIGSEFRSVLMPLLGQMGRESEYVERRLTRRIMGLEAELVRLRSNPALEKKVAKLEEEVRKVRYASVVGESEGKEQEDILKKYKAAEKRVFVIMPFATQFDDVWRGGIERACNSQGLVCLRVDQISLSTWITEDIEKCVEMANVVISDITGSNPNVMFELGWALAKGKKPIVIRQQDDPNQVPFDVHDIRYIPYINSWSGVESLFKQVCKFIKSTSETLEAEPSKTEREKKSKMSEIQKKKQQK